MANRIEEIPEEEFEETKAKFKSKTSRVIASSEDMEIVRPVVSIKKSTIKKEVETTSNTTRIDDTKSHVSAKNDTTEVIPFEVDENAILNAQNALQSITTTLINDSTVAEKSVTSDMQSNIETIFSGHEEIADKLVNLHTTSKEDIDIKEELEEEYKIDIAKKAVDDVLASMHSLAPEDMEFTLDPSTHEEKLAAKFIDTPRRNVEETPTIGKDIEVPFFMKPIDMINARQEYDRLLDENTTEEKEVEVYGSEELDISLVTSDNNSSGSSTDSTSGDSEESKNSLDISIKEEPKMEEIKVEEKVVDTVLTKKINVITTPTELDEDILNISVDDIEPTEEVSAPKEIKDMISAPYNPNMPGIKVNTPRAGINVPLVEEENIVKLLSDVNNKEFTDKEKSILVERLTDPNSIETRISDATNFFTHAQRFEHETVNELHDKGHELTNCKIIGNEKYYDKKAGKNQAKNIANGAVINSKDSLPFMFALISGIRQVHFYDSGFWVTVRSPRIDELHLYYTTCRTNTDTFGKMFGQMAYIPADIEIRKAGIDLFKKCIINSNLANWNVGDTFEKNLSYFDYKTCLWALASLMFNDGANIDFTCLNDDCAYVDSVKVDISKLRIYDYTRLGEEALKYCYSDEIRTEEDIINYKNNILKISSDIDLTDEWVLSLKVPSFYEAMQDGLEYVSELSKNIQLTDMESVTDHVAARYYRIVSPWIEKISYRNIDDGKIMHFKDKSIIPNAINSLQLTAKDNDTSLTDKLHAFIKDNQISYYCYSYTECPKCHTAPSVAIDGLIPCDIQQAFFILTAERIM